MHTRLICRRRGRRTWMFNTNAYAFGSTAPLPVDRLGAGGMLGYDSSAQGETRHYRNNSNPAARLNAFGASKDDIGVLATPVRLTRADDRALIRRRRGRRLRQTRRSPATEPTVSLQAIPGVGYRRHDVPHQPRCAYYGRPISTSRAPATSTQHQREFEPASPLGAPAVAAAPPPLPAFAATSYMVFFDWDPRTCRTRPNRSSSREPFKAKGNALHGDRPPTSRVRRTTHGAVCAVPPGQGRHWCVKADGDGDSGDRRGEANPLVQTADVSAAAEPPRRDRRPVNLLTSTEKAACGPPFCGTVFCGPCIRSDAAAASRDWT